MRTFAIEVASFTAAVVFTGSAYVVFNRTAATWARRRDERRAREQRRDYDRWVLRQRARYQMDRLGGWEEAPDTDT